MDQVGRSLSCVSSSDASDAGDDLFLERHDSTIVLRVTVVMALDVGPAQPSAVLSIGFVFANDSDEIFVVDVDFIVIDVLIVEIAVERPLDLAAVLAVLPIERRRWHDDTRRQIKHNHRHRFNPRCFHFLTWPIAGKNLEKKNKTNKRKLVDLNERLSARWLMNDSRRAPRFIRGFLQVNDSDSWNKKQKNK